jgi:hypothetical protein
MYPNPNRFKDYMRQKETNNLVVTKKEEKYLNSLKRLDLTPFPEGILTTDNYFILQNFKTGGFLVIDTEDRNQNYENAFAVTTNPLINFACPRSLFKLEKFENKSNSSNPQTINYGDKFNISTHPEIFNEPLYLFSTLSNPYSHSKFSHNQEVLVVNQKNYNTSWIIEHPDCTLRYSMEGKPVSLMEGFIIRHCATGRLLASDLIEYFNDYGKEYEVCCNNYVSQNKYQTLIAEKEGKLKIDTKTRTEKEQNIWGIVDQII